MKLKHICFWLLLGSLSILACRSEKKKDSPVKIAAASNLQFVLEALTKVFSENTGIACETVLSSSGKLTAQIREGAPYDLFLSADMKFPQTLYEQGMTYAPPKVYGYGRVILWSAIEGLIPDLDSLNSPDIRHIAIANPKTAPYGSAALEVLQALKKIDQVNSKLVYGENISQTNQFITSGSAEVGFTAKSVVEAPLLKNLGQWIDVPSNYHQPIQQGIVQIKRKDSNLEKARQFYDFIFSTEGKTILKDFGYLIDE